MKTYILTFATVAVLGVFTCVANVHADDKTDKTDKKNDGPKNGSAANKFDNKGSSATIFHDKAGRALLSHLRDFRGWSAYCWFPRYQCYGYYSAADHQWFYWYKPFGRYLPIKYIATYPPTPVGTGVVPPAIADGQVPPAGADSVPLPPDATNVPNDANRKGKGNGGNKGNGPMGSNN